MELGSHVARDARRSDDAGFDPATALDSAEDHRTRLRGRATVAEPLGAEVAALGLAELAAEEHLVRLTLAGQRFFVLPHQLVANLC